MSTHEPPASFKRPRDKNRYSFLDRHCIGRSCWAPGLYQHRGATMSGSRNTGDETACCMNRAYRGCPHPLPESSGDHAKVRKAEGWRRA